MESNTKPFDLVLAHTFAEQITEWREDDSAGTEAAAQLLDQLEPYLRSISGWQQHPAFSVDNPSPTFMRYRNLSTGYPQSDEDVEDKSLIALFEPDVIVLDCAHDPDAQRYRAIGVNYDGNDPDCKDIAYGDTAYEAMNRYRAEALERAQQRAQDNFIVSDKRLTIAREIYAEHDLAVDNLNRLCGVGHHWQDAEGTVYVIEPQVWMKVKVKPVTVNRTRREGEKAGELSLTRAREFGYIVEGEAKKEPKQKAVIPESELINQGMTTK